MQLNKVFIAIKITSICLFASNSFVGIVQPLKDVTLSFPISGVIHKKLIKEGSLVKKNDALIKLDDSLASLEAKKRLLIYRDKSRLNSLKNEVKIIKSMLNVTKKLYNQNGAVSKDEVQSIQIKYETTLGALNSIKENEKKENLEYKIATKLLSQYTLKSPINGKVSQINFDKGEWVKTGEKIIRIVDSSKCLINLNIKKENINEFKLNSLVDISLSNDKRKIKKEGKISFISPLADFASGLVLVKVEFDNKDLEVFPGHEAVIKLKE